MDNEWRSDSGGSDGICDRGGGGKSWSVPYYYYSAMNAAGIKGPYYPTTTTYSWKCVLSLGLAVKAPVTVIGNKVVANGPKIAAALGGGANTVAAAEGAAAVWSNPITATIGVAVATDEVLKHCECEK